MAEIFPIVDTGGDDVLRTFARLAQENGVTTGLTLTVGAAVLTGIVIGRDAWLERLAAELASAGDLGQVTGQALEHEFMKADLERSGQEPYDFLHFADARFVYGDSLRPAPPLPGQLWRGRICEISGWSFGRHTC